MYNACRWPIVGRSEHCEKPCINDFCGIHRTQLRRRPGTEPMPCRKYGRDTKSETQLCSKPCHSDHAKKALHRAEAKVRRLHPVLNQKLLQAAHRQQMTHYLLIRRFEQSMTTSKRFWRCLKKSRKTSLSPTERHWYSAASCEVGRWISLKAIPQALM